jgi:hypothetical protein
MKVLNEFNKIEKWFLIALIPMLFILAIMTASTVFDSYYPYISPLSSAKTAQELYNIYDTEIHQSQGIETDKFSVFVDSIRAKDDLSGFWKIFTQDDTRNIRLLLKDKADICGQASAKAALIKNNKSLDAIKDAMDSEDSCLHQISLIHTYYNFELDYFKHLNSFTGKNLQDATASQKNAAFYATEEDTLSSAASVIHTAYDGITSNNDDDNHQSLLDSFPANMNDSNDPHHYLRDQKEALQKMETCNSDTQAQSADCIQGGKLWQDTEERLANGINQTLAEHEKQQDQIIEDERLRESVRRSYGQY